MNIAICDDEENIRIYIRKLIQKQEPFCKITEFSSGKELLELRFLSMWGKFRQYTSTRITGSFKKNGRNILWKNNRSKP